MITSSDMCRGDKEVLLYDFAEPEHSYFGEMMGYLPPVLKGPFTYETLDGELHTSYHYDDRSDKFMLVEGLGILPISDKCTGDYDDPIAGDLTGFILFIPGNSQGGVPYLYEVEAPDGTALYACESKRYKPEGRYFYFVDYYREWHYRLVDRNPWIDPSEGIFRKPDIDLVLKCETDELVGDKYYWVVNAYIDGSETPLGNRPYVYLCEDWFDEGKVWARIPDDQVALPYVTEFSCSEVGDDVLLYDFTDITNSAILRYSYFGESQSESDFIKRDYIAADGFHHTCFQHKDRSDVIFVDGFGMLPAEEQATSYNTAPYPGDFLGMVPLHDGIGEHYVPYLYEITDKGQTIYRNDYCGEMTGLEDVDASENVDWQIGSDCVTIGSSRPIGEVKVTSLSGMVVRSVTTDAQSYTIDLSEMPAGIYVVSAAGTARKVVVR